MIESTLVLYDITHWLFAEIFDFYIIGFALLIISSFGILFMQSSLVILLMCFEIFLVTIGYLFLVTAVFFGSISGVLFVYLLLIVAGAESALSLSVLTAYFFVERHVQVDLVNGLKG